VLTPGTILRIRHAPPPKPAAPAPRFITHRVASGENLTSIARRYHTTVSAIQRANGLGNKTRILVGQRLRVPQS
jgi:membrane-bound lytic murein transglycosylase D